LGTPDQSESRAATGFDHETALIRPESIRDPEEALREEEIRRTRMLDWLIISAVAVACPMLLVAGGDPFARQLAAASLIFYAATAGWFHLKTRNPKHYTERTLATLAFSGVIAGAGCIYYWGVFSPAPVVIAIAVFATCMAGSFRYTFVVYLTCALLLLAMATLIMTGTIEDRGLLQAPTTGFGAKLATQFIMQAILLASFVVGRLTRRTALETLIERDRIAGEIAAREAQLAEARGDLKRSAWIGGPGQYTGESIDSFKLGIVLGRGAMGEVYEATRDGDDEAYAIKLLRLNVLDDDDKVTRFAREAEAVAAMNSPHVVRIIDIGGENSLPYIAMEKLVGSDLSTLLRERPQLSLEETLELVSQLALGLECARKAGIVHRDLKPQNIFYSEGEEEPQWKILDFGVTKFLGSEGTLTGDRIVGTPSYMSAEQALGEDVDHRTDVYGLAAVAYRCLTGHPPFTQGKRVPVAMLYDVRHRNPMRPGSLIDTPEQIDLALLLGLAKDPDNRFDTAMDLANALSAAALGELDENLASKARQLLSEQGWGAIVEPSQARSG
jgi:serine/threonine-protein kinase